jgi:hypothetical protein
VGNSIASFEGECGSVEVGSRLLWIQRRTPILAINS